MGDFGVRGRRVRRGVNAVLRHKRSGVIVVRRRRVFARKPIARADKRDGAGNDGANQRQQDDA